MGGTACGGIWVLLWWAGWKWKWSCSVVSDSSRPHGLQPTRLLCPWDFTGKSTGGGCHFRVMLSKSLTQFSVNGWGYVCSPSFGLRLNYDRDNDSNGNLLQKDLHQHSVAACCTDCCIQGPNPVAGLLECLKNYGQKFTTLYKRQWPKLLQRKRNAKRQNGCLRRPYK